MKKITKEEFKKIFIEHGIGHPDPRVNKQAAIEQWEHSYEKQQNATYFFEPPSGLEKTRMQIVTDYAAKNSPVHRIFFISEEDEELSYQIGRGE